MIYIGLDDTDTLETRGTGRLARLLAAELADDFPLLGVTRHQLLLDPRIRYTAKNSCAAICLDAAATTAVDLAGLFERLRARLLAEFVEGSDPGLCLAPAETARALADFGRRAQRQVLSQAQALRLAESCGARLEALGGDGSGVIGALAAVGLAASGEDGRYVLVGGSRQVSGPLPLEQVLALGIPSVCTADGQPVREGLVLADKLRPARRGGAPVLYVERQGDYWLPLKLD